MSIIFKIACWFRVLDEPEYYSNFGYVKKTGIFFFLLSSPLPIIMPPLGGMKKGQFNRLSKDARKALKAGEIKPSDLSSQNPRKKRTRSEREDGEGIESTERVFKS
jgi:hypothetical protein